MYSIKLESYSTNWFTSCFFNFRIYAGDFPYWQILIYLILLRRIKSRRGGGLKWGNPERLPRGGGDSLTYLRGAGRWLQTRQENSICYNYEVPGMLLPSPHLLLTPSTKDI